MPLDFDVREPVPKSGEDLWDHWHDQVNGALEWRRNLWNGDSMWRMSRRMERAEFWRNSRNGPDLEGQYSDTPKNHLSYPITTSMVQDFLSFLVTENVEYRVGPTTRKPGTASRGKKQTAILNYFFRQRDMNRQMRRAVHNALVVGHGIIKTGFSLKTDPSVNVDKHGFVNVFEYVQEDSPFIRSVNPFHFIRDPLAPDKDIASSQWVAEVFFDKPRRVMANEDYDKEVLRRIENRELSPTTVDGFVGKVGSVTGHTFTRRLSEELWVKFEVWDKNRKKRYVFLDGVPDPLIEEEWPYEYLLGGFPYLEFEWMRLSDDDYAVGIPFMIMDSQYEANRVLTKRMIHHRRINRKYQMPMAALDDKNKAALMEDEDGSAVEYDPEYFTGAGGGPIGEVGDLTQSIDTDKSWNQIKSDVRELLGADAIIRGGPLPSRTTATEVNKRVDLFARKLEGRIEALEKFYVDVGTQVLNHLQKHMHRPREVQILGKRAIEQENAFVKVGRNDIAGDFDLKVDKVTADRFDPDDQQRKKMQQFQIMLQGMQNPIVLQALLKRGLDVAELYEWALENLGETEFERFYARTDEDLLTQARQLQLGGDQGNLQPRASTRGESEGGGPQPGSPGTDVTGAIFGGANLGDNRGRAG